MNLLAQLLFGWIFAALTAGTPPAQFDTNGHYLGAPHAPMYSRLK